MLAFLAKEADSLVGAVDEAVSNSVSKAPGNSEVQIGERSSRQHAVMPGVLLLPCKVFTFLLLYSDFFVCVRARSVFSQTKNETQRTLVPKGVSLSRPRRQQMPWVGQGSLRSGVVVVVGAGACRENVTRVVRESKLSPCYFYPRHHNTVMPSWAVFF